MPVGHDSVSAALEQAIASYGTMVRRVGWQHRLSESDLDELLQEVRIRLWRARGESEQIETVSTSYVYRTAVSAALDIIRRRRSGRAESHDSIDETDGVALATARTPEAVLDESELAEVVSGIVDGIATNRRPVVRMYLAGYSREEIAETLGWSEAKTRNLLYRGLADLRERLTERGIGWNVSAQDAEPLDGTTT